MARKPQTATAIAEETATIYPVGPDDTTDWLLVAQRIASLYKPPHTGRPSDALTDVQRVYKLLSLAAEGNYLQTAVRSAGFAKKTYYDWQEQAKHGNLAAIALLDALEKAVSDAETEDNRAIRKASNAGPQYWPAAATRLERRHPERWGKRQDDASVPKVVVQIGVQQGDVQIALSPPQPVHAVTSSASTVVRGEAPTR